MKEKFAININNVFAFKKYKKDKTLIFFDTDFDSIMIVSESFEEIVDTINDATENQCEKLTKGNKTNGRA